MNLDMTIPHTSVTVLQALTAVAVLVAGFIAARIVASVFRRQMRRTRLSEILVEFILRFLSVLLYVLVVLIALGTLGVSIGSVVLSLSAIVGLVLGFGLQDTFNNVASGAWIAALSPINIGEVVTINGMTGKVTAVGIMATELLTPDNVYMAIPNKLVWGSPIINMTRMDTRRVDVAVGVAYGSSVDEAIRTGMNVMTKHPLVLGDPEPAVVITELADSSVNLALRAWAKTEDYWTVRGDLTKGIYEALPEAGIEIPYPQLDVHVTQR